MVKSVRVAVLLLTGGLAAGSCAGAAPHRSSVDPPSVDSIAPAGARSRPMRFALIGDQGSGEAPQHAVAHRMCRWRRNHSFRLVFTAGDNVYDHGEPSRFVETFYEPYECLLSNGAQFHASLGNHDVETAEGAAELANPDFGFKNAQGNYVVRKRHVRFVVADAPHLDFDWLRRNTREEPGDRWTIVIFHFPVYSSGGYKTHAGYVPMMPRLFKKRGVDLVINGHDHLYSVTKELNGIRYVISGGGGASLYACHDRWFADKCRSAHHFLYVVAGRNLIKVRAVPRHGRPFDRFSTTGREPAP